MANNTTLTASAYSVLRENHVGVTTVRFTKSALTTKYGTAGDTILLAKIPTGALLLDGRIYGKADDLNVSALVVWNGNGGSGTTTLITSFSVADGGSSVASFDIPGNYRISMSDDNAIRYATLALRNTSGSETTSYVVTGYIMYDFSDD